MTPTARSGGPPEGPTSDNQSSDPHGATVNTTGRPVVVSGAYGLTAEKVQRLRDSVADVPVCPECVARRGACGYCLNRVGPKRPRNPMAAVTLSGDRDADTTAKHVPLSREGAKVKARKARKARKAAERTPPVLGPEPVVVVLDGAKRKKARNRRPGMLGFLDAIRQAA